MEKLENHKDNRDPLEIWFPHLSRFCEKMKQVVWKQDDVFLNDVLIVSVEGFPNAGSLREFLNKTCLEDINRLKKDLRKLSKENRIKLLQTCIGLSEDIKNWAVEEGVYIEHRLYARFKWWDVPYNEKVSYDLERILIRNVDPFVKAFLSSVEDLTFNLKRLKIEIEEIEDDPLTFKYVGYDKQPEDLLILFDELKVKEFIDSKLNSSKDFKAIFSGKPKINPIVWRKNYAELWWFVKTLKDEGKLINNVATNKRACNCFVIMKEDGSVVAITENQLNKTYKPKTAKDSETMRDIQTIIKKKLPLGNPKK